MGQVATTALAILLSAAIARVLGPSEFGVLYLITTVGMFAYVFVDWGHALRELPSMANAIAPLTAPTVNARLFSIWLDPLGSPGRLGG